MDRWERPIQYEVMTEVQMKMAFQDPGQTTRDCGERNVGFTADGTPVHLYVLKDHSIEAAIMNYGARVVSIRTPDRYGNIANVVLDYSGLDGYVADISSYLGAVVGRYANRIAAGHVTINGRAFQTVTNDNGNALHGGFEGFDRRVWTATCFSSGVDL